MAEWLTAAGIAEAHELTEGLVANALRVTGMRDASKAHARGEGSAREYSPAAQGETLRELRSRGKLKQSTLRTRQAKREPAVMARLEAGQPPPVMTVAQLRAKVEQAEALGMLAIKLTVRRRTRPSSCTGIIKTRPIRLPLLREDGSKRWGPDSSADSEVVRADGPESWEATWRVGDLRVWLTTCSKGRSRPGTKPARGG